MKRDMELIRSIMLQLELGEPLKFEGYDDQTVAYHVRMLIEAGYVEGESVGTSGGLYSCVSHVTWAGHDFTDAARDPARWKKAKDIVAEKGGAVTFDVLKQLLATLMKQALGLG